MYFRWCVYGESRQNIIRLDLELVLGDVRLMSRAKIYVFGFTIYSLWCERGESRKYNNLLYLTRDVLLVGRARILSVAVFNKQVNNGRSSELCSAMFLDSEDYE